MKARVIMTAPVITVKPSASVREVAELFFERRICAVPVVDDQGKLVGIVSESDLIHRAEAGTERKRSWLLQGLTGDETLATEYVQAHSRKVGDVMTRRVITASPDTPLHEIASLLESQSIKRVPIVKDGQIICMVSRANLIQAVASDRKELEIPVSDEAIRQKILANLKTEPWAHTGLLNVIVKDGVVDLFGITGSDAERKAIRVAAELVPGVCAVHDNLIGRPIAAGI
jgi:CBS domain-containing protein